MHPVLYLFFTISAVNAQLLSQTPAMNLNTIIGWNAWNQYACNINEKIIKRTADALIDTGLAAVGYTYLNLDDCWQTGRNATTHEIIVDAKSFPSGMESLGNFIHSKNLKFGIYSSAGTRTCDPSNRPGSLGYEFMDANSYASWGVDYLKYDNCNNKLLIGKKRSIARYKKMGDALRSTNRDIIYSICNWGQDEPWLWSNQVSGQSYRTTADIGNTFSKSGIRCSPCLNRNPSTCFYFGNSCSVLNILDKQVMLTRYAKPGSWNDLDMLQVGNEGMTIAEEVAHFSLWAALKSPLLISTDLTKIRKESLDILLNHEVIMVNQDELGESAHLVLRIYDNGWFGLGKKIEYDIWAGNLARGDLVVILFNRSPVQKTIKFDLELIRAELVTYVVRDLWLKYNVGFMTDFFSADVEAMSCVMYRLSPQVVL